MAYKIIDTPDGEHEGEVLETVEVNNVITFVDGDVFVIREVMATFDGKHLIAISDNYQIKLMKI